ncbi:MAG: phosphoribosylglycinamide formyltransferase [bacterium]
MSKTKLAIFVSGSGSNFEAIALVCANGTIDAEVSLMVCDNPKAFAIERAGRLNIPTLVLSPKEFASKTEYEQAIVAELDSQSIDFVCLAGYMRIVGETLYSAYKDRILNIHPALLPSFKGAHAIDDAFNFGVKVFGVTVHFIDLTIDGGVIVMQRAFEYNGTDRNEVEQKIHEIEHILYPEAINLVIKNSRNKF